MSRSTASMAHLSSWGPRLSTRAPSPLSLMFGKGSWVDLASPLC